MTTMKQIVVVIIILLVVIFALLMSSCATIPDTAPDYASFHSLREINEWVYGSIRYDGVYKDEDTVQSPQTTLSIRHGTCFDKCVLFVWIAKQSGWSVKVLPVETKTGYHVVVDCGSSGIYDPTNGTFLGYNLPSGWKITTF